MVTRKLLDLIIMMVSVKALQNVGVDFCNKLPACLSILSQFVFVWLKKTS